ncbi:MAG: DinB family protein [Gemmatimonadetes bacterium]|nr:DinB family protein [Gemmatimonadota bacterium]
MADDALRSHLVRLLTWQDAHVSFEGAVQGLSASVQGVRPEGAPYSPWQLLEHLRLTQLDILEFCRNAAHEEPRWPDDYWPTSPKPPTADAWERSVASYLEDRAALVRLAEDPGVDLFARIPHGTGQTYLRELLLAADHSAYHVGQLVLVRRLLGAWPAA